MCFSFMAASSGCKMTRKMREVDYLSITKVAIHCCSAVASSLGAVTDTHVQNVTDKHMQNVTDKQTKLA